MNILITGASGMIGQALYQHLHQQHTLTVLGRDKTKLMRLFPDAIAFDWQDLANDCENVLANVDQVIHLAGENIGAKRWSHAQKKCILDSRVHSTSLLTRSLAQLAPNAPRLLAASAIGIYDFASNQVETQWQHVFTENSPLPSNPQSFLSEVALAWEDALMPAKQANIDVVTMRFAVVLSQKGGALAKMLPSFRLGAGAVLGSGRQPVSWIGLTDLVRAITLLINTPDFNQAINLVAPNVVTQRELADTLAKFLHRPRWLNMPASFVRFLFGEMADELLLNGQHVASEGLKTIGFQFQTPDLMSCLATPEKTKGLT